MPWTIPERPALIGSEWVRRQPLGDEDPWDRVKVTGVFDLGEGRLEIVVVPLAAFASPESCAPEALAGEYTRTGGPTGPDFAHELSERLRRVEAAA